MGKLRLWLTTPFDATLLALAEIGLEEVLKNGGEDRLQDLLKQRCEEARRCDEEE
jgi:hypothetical protein